MGGRSRSCLRLQIASLYPTVSVLVAYIRCIYRYIYIYIYSHTCVVPDHGPFAALIAILAVAEDSKVNTTIGSEGNALDEGRRQRREQQQHECDEE
jgi:hypothetical protein